MPSRLQIVLWLDISLLISVCALEHVPFTGLILHEWLGVAIVVMIVAHLLLSWAWIASTTPRLISGASHRTRFNYFLNVCLFACMTAAVFSGILISQHAVPALTGQSAKDLQLSFQWDRVHDQSSNLVVLFAILHLAINWDWLSAAIRRLWR
jgi:hypothetical protein